MPLSTAQREGLEAVLPDLDSIPESILGEVPGAVHRALQAGARVPLRYLGAGMTAVVLGDAQGRAYKVGRHPHSPTNVQTLTTEAEWLADAKKVPALSGRVVRFVRFIPQLLTIVNEEVVRENRPGGRDLWDTHQAIAALMKPRGWGPPEYKDDSYVWSAHGPVLVDASATLRFGPRLLRYALDIAAGRRPLHGERVADLQWELRMEAGEGRISEKDAVAASAQLDRIKR